MALVGLVHTTRLVIEPLHRVVARHCPDIEIAHVLDEGILRALAAAGSITPEIVAWLADMVGSAARAGADCAVVSCSSLSPCVAEVGRTLPLPVVRVDEPMMEEVLGKATRIGLVMTNPTTEAPSTRLFREVAERLQSEATLVPRLCPDAFARLNRGDVAGHDRAVIATVEELLGEVELVMLAQISMARVQEQLAPEVRARVYSSLDCLPARIDKILSR